MSPIKKIDLLISCKNNINKLKMKNSEYIYNITQILKSYDYDNLTKIISDDKKKFAYLYPKIIDNIDNDESILEYLVTEYDLPDVEYIYVKCCKNGYTNLVDKILLSKEINVDYDNHLGLYNAMFYNNMDIVNLLISYYYENSIYINDIYLYELYHENRDMINIFIINFDFDIDFVITLFIDEKDWELVNLLWKFGDDYLETIIYLIEYECVDNMRYLIYNYYGKTIDNNINIIFEFFCTYGNVDDLDYLYNIYYQKLLECKYIYFFLPAIDNKNYRVLDILFNYFNNTIEFVESILSKICFDIDSIKIIIDMFPQINIHNTKLLRNSCSDVKNLKFCIDMFQNIDHSHYLDILLYSCENGYINNIDFLINYIDIYNLNDNYYHKLYLTSNIIIIKKLLSYGITCENNFPTLCAIFNDGNIELLNIFMNLYNLDEINYVKEIIFAACNNKKICLRKLFQLYPDNNIDSNVELWLYYSCLNNNIINVNYLLQEYPNINLINHDIIKISSKCAYYNDRILKSLLKYNRDVVLELLKQYDLILYDRYV